MREGWKLQTLGDLGTLTSSKRIFKSEYVTEGIPFYRSKEIKELGNGRDISLELYITNERYNEIKEQFGVPLKGDILLTAVGTIGEMYVVDESHPFYFKDGNIMWLKNFDSLDSYFLKYALTLFVEQLKAMSQGSAYSALTIEKLKKYSIPAPPLPEQKQIVAILDQAFEAIDQAKANIEKNIQNAKELFQSKLNDIFSQPARPAGGKGEGWEEKTLGELGTLTSSKRIYKDEYVSEGVAFYRSKEIKELAHNRDISLELYISEKRYLEIKSKFGIPKEGDILLTAVGTIGEMYVVQEKEPPFYFKDGNIMWLKDFNNLNTYYLKYALMCFVEQLKAMSQGSAYSALTIEKLKKYSISVPSIDIQNKLVTEMDAVRTHSIKLENLYIKKVKELEELKKSILQKAFAGELTLSESGLSGLEDKQDLNIAAEPLASYNNQEILKSSKS